MSIRLVDLSLEDGRDIYEMLQRIGACENEFKNTAHDLSFDEYKDWLKEQYDWARGVNLPQGYVPQSIFWLFDDDVPVGMGKIRHELNENSRRIGGNIGYAVDPGYRGKGYATFLLGKLINKAKELKIEEILLSVEKYNPASRRVIEKNGGRFLYENDERWFFTFE
ncbi:MAG: GNAT family N-acetyltransferase [Eubacterium sp.]|nr:GNAT family N-acetyltransferase [Eubacterium sp.]